MRLRLPELPHKVLVLLGKPALVARDAGARAGVRGRRVGVRAVVAIYYEEGETNAVHGSRFMVAVVSRSSYLKKGGQTERERTGNRRRGRSSTWRSRWERWSIRR